MNGFDAKELSKELPHSQTWQSVKREEVKNVARKMINSDPVAKQALQDTGNKEIRHTVGNTEWGTGGTNNVGDNEYGEILMELREEFFGSEFTVRINKDTKVLLLTDSQGKHIRATDFFQNDRVMIRKTPTAKSLMEFARNAPVNRPNVEKIVVGVGINDVENGTADIEESIKESMDILAMKFPKATIAYTEALYKGTNQAVTQLNQHMLKICEERHYKFARQSMGEMFFTNETHINEVGTKIMVSNIYRAFNLPQKQTQQKSTSTTAQHSGRYYQSKGYKGNESKRFQHQGKGSQTQHFDQNIPVHIGGRQGPPFMFKFPPPMYGYDLEQGYYSGQGHYNQNGPYYNNQYGYSQTKY